jgi:hypothetical protein
MLCNGQNLQEGLLAGVAEELIGGIQTSHGLGIVTAGF